MTTEETKAAADKAAADRAAAEKATADRSAGDKAAADKAAASRGGATEAARSISEAIRRVTDAAVAEIQKMPTVAEGDFVCSGTAGGRFNVDGPVGSFGTNGTVTLNGVQLETRGWGTMHIEGVLPQDAKSGELVVHIDDKTNKRGRLTL